MKITIDTKEDSQEDIRKVIQILTHIAGNQSTILTNSNTPSSNPESVMDMFSDAPVSTLRMPERDQGTPPGFSSFLSLTAQHKEEKKENIPKIEFF